jgi:threonyl-tRNA synthetase
VIGEREAESGTVSVRSNKEGELGEMSAESLIEKLKKEIDTKAY